MKRFFIIFVAFLFLVIYVDKFNSNYYVIPDDSIRIRIIANSDSFDDQYIKIKVKQLIEPVIEEDLSVSSSLNESRFIIKSNLNKYNSMISSYLIDNSCKFLIFAHHSEVLDAIEEEVKKSKIGLNGLFNK